MFTSGGELYKSVKELLALENIIAKKEAIQKAIKTAPPFEKQENTEKAKSLRIKKCKKDFWQFDKTYFPKENYQDYSPAGWFQKELIVISDKKDKKAHVIAGSRDSAKTATFKKKIIYDILFGKRNFMMIGSETLNTPTAFVLDVINFLMLNERINNDYQIEYVESNKERLYIRTDQNPRGTYIDTISDERSSRGKNRGLFLRPDFIFITDFENATSSFSDTSVSNRIARINEMRTSLSKNGTVIWEGNNFDVRCAMNQLFKEETEGIISPEFGMHRFPAFDETRTIPSIWKERYPAKTESQMRQNKTPRIMQHITTKPKSAHYFKRDNSEDQ